MGRNFARDGTRGFLVPVYIPVRDFPAILVGMEQNSQPWYIQLSLLLKLRFLQPNGVRGYLGLLPPIVLLHHECSSFHLSRLALCHYAKKLMALFLF
jgi:hypothetical protein